MKEFNSFDNYLKSLGKCIFLNAKEERELIEKAQAGDMKARDKIVQANLRFVVDQARKMVRAGCNADIEDLIGAGNIGLVKAVSKFKLEKNVRFITCAAFWIHAEMSEEAGLTNAIHLPHNCQLMLKKIRAVEKDIPEGLSQAAGYEFIANKIGATKSAVRAIIESSRNITSLDSFASEDDEANLYSFVSDDSVRDPFDEAAAKEFKGNFKKVLRKIPADERRVLESHYGLNGSKGMSLDEIARSWGKEITREGIRQKEIKAMKRFREEENRMLFEDLFGKAV